jgi:HAD superfamily hydrolase (TIGR01509 family)
MTKKRQSGDLVLRLKNALGLILDMDGTLLDSFNAHVTAWERVLDDRGVNHTREEILAPFGKPTPVIASILFATDDQDLIQSITRSKARYFIEQIPSIELFPGTRAVLEALHAGEKKMCIASSSPNITIETTISELGLGSLIDAFVGLNDVTSSKPDPEMIFKSAARLHLDPADCIVIGDTIYDIQAGNAAGCFSIGVLTGNSTRGLMEQAGAGAVLDAFAKLQEYLS